MATGSGKTFTAITAIYRLIKFAGARRVLFLVDRGNLGDQTEKEFQQYRALQQLQVHRGVHRPAPDEQHPRHHRRVCICTIQRMYSMLKGRSPKTWKRKEASGSQFETGGAALQGAPSPSNTTPPPHRDFDIIVTDEATAPSTTCGRRCWSTSTPTSIGLTATPSKQTFGFFNQNLVMEYNHEMAVADGVNVNYDVYRIRTKITEQGLQGRSGLLGADRQDRETRKKRWEQLDDDFAYDPNQLDRDVVAPDQIRTIIRTFRDKLHGNLPRPHRGVPKTLIFAKDDSHAENIVEIVREEFGKGNDFAQKITYKHHRRQPKDLINRPSATATMPRIAVTVDMIATGTDIKPMEIVMFMRAVKSRVLLRADEGPRRARHRGSRSRRAGGGGSRLSSASGWRPSGTTSRRTSRSRRTTSGTPRSRRRAGWGRQAAYSVRI
jgi:type I restriction enzyme, R subunit